jgi:hypothetical protein
MGVSACPRCARDVALHEGRPFVSASGAVELWHGACWETRDSVCVESAAINVAPIPARRWRVARGSIATGVALVALLAGSYRLRVELPSASLAAIDTEIREPLGLRTHATTHEAAPPELDERDLYPVPLVHDMPLDEM